MSIVRDLSSVQARVIGALIEKSITTHDQYPLSLNALTAACNQKSNREPVMSLSETQVQETIDELTQKRLVSTETGFGSRVSKYKHRFCNTPFSELQLSDAARAIICVMLLRGAQTPGELRTRTQRLHDFQNVEQVEEVLQQLIDDSRGPFVAKLSREPGRRECRYIELFSAETAHTQTSSEVIKESHSADNDDRIELLEMQLDEVQQELSIIKQKLKQLLGEG